MFSSRTCSNTSLLRGLSYKELWNLFLPWAFAWKFGILLYVQNLSSPHLLTFPPDTVQVMSISALGPNLPLPRHVTLATAPVFTSPVVTFINWMLLTISHTWHLPVCRVSSLDACQITIALPFTIGFPYIHKVSLTPSCLSPLGGAPWASFQTQSLLLQHLISHWDRSHSTFVLWPCFLVFTRSHWHISLFSVFLSCPLVFTDPPWAQKCCTQTLDSTTMKGSFYRSAWCVK